MSEPLLPFIPLWLENCNLTPHQYRVLCHFWSRGQGRCFPALDTIADCCGINVKTAKRTVKELENLGLATRRKRKAPGIRFSNEYILTGPKGTPVKNQPAQKEPPLTGPKETPPNRPKGDPGNVQPLKGTPLKENISFDDDCQAGDFKLFPETELEPFISKNQLAESIYLEYPRKVKKPKAIESILKAFKTNSPDHLLERTKAYAAAIGWQERRYIPHPTTWFNSEQFNDDPIEWEQPNKTTHQPTRPAVNVGPRTADNVEYV